jgi:hypothetical protein
LTPKEVRFFVIWICILELPTCSSPPSIKPDALQESEARVFGHTLCNMLYMKYEPLIKKLLASPLLKDENQERKKKKKSFIFFCVKLKQKTK